MSSRLSKALLVVLPLIAFASTFAAHQWWTASNQVSEAATSEQRAAVLNDHVEQVQQSVAQLAALVESGGDKQAIADQTSEIISEIDAALASLLENKTHVDSEDLELARMSQVRAYYLAAKQRPDSYREQFDTLSSRLMRDLPGSISAVEASILRFATQHDLTKPLDSRGFQALQEQANGYSNQQNGVALYSYVSRQLYSNGQSKSAEAVLDAGTSQYKGKPGWHHLFGQKFQQGHLTVPQPTVAGGAFETSSLRSSASRQWQSPWRGGSS